MMSTNLIHRPRSRPFTLDVASPISKRPDARYSLSRRKLLTLLPGIG